MTKRFSSLNWRDALYNSVRRAPGGVVAAAIFLTERRGVSIHPESLRRKLTGGEQLDPDLCLLLQEWMLELEGGREYARDWAKALSQQAELSVVEMPPEPTGGFADEADALNKKALQAVTELGEMCAAISSTTADGRITDEEMERVVAKSSALIELLFRVNRNVTRWHKKDHGLGGSYELNN